MNRKNMPLLLMLIAGACTWIVTLVRSYSLLASLVALFTVMLLFYCLGSVIRLLLDRFDRQNEEKAKQEQEEKEKRLKTTFFLMQLEKIKFYHQLFLQQENGL